MKKVMICAIILSLAILSVCDKPLFYYNGATQRYGLQTLGETLNTLQWDSNAYQIGEFDCSEMSAYLERELENKGYHTVIVVGRKHAWLMVEFERQAYIPIEATTSQIIMPNNPQWESYYKYVAKFETIEDALRHSQTEFDWWNKEN